MSISGFWRTCVALIVVLMMGCGTQKDRRPQLPEGIHWDAASGVLTFRHGRRTSTIHFVRLEAGSFLMGGPDHPGTILVEGPPRRCRITKGFWLSATEVTRGQWHAFSGDKPPTDPDLPMTRVAWTEVQAFVRRLQRHSGAEFRLPSEAEWEYACRAGTSTPWPWEHGRRQLSRFGWYRSNAGSSLHEVATREPNPLGLFDMNGNAVEWTQDASGKGNRILRGGLILSAAEGTDCSCRYHYPAAYGYQYAGFRLAVD